MAWVTVRCPETDDQSVGMVHRARADGSAEVTQPIGPDLAHVVGFVGHRVVYVMGFNGGSWVTDFSGPPSRIPRLESVRDVSESTRMVIGQRGQRARIVAEIGGQVRWRLSQGHLVSFSPNGKRVLALTEGTGRRVSLLNCSTGAAQVSFSLPAGVLAESIVWESNHTLLALMKRTGRVAIVRLDSAGHVERTTPTVRAARRGLPYVVLDP